MRWTTAGCCQNDSLVKKKPEPLKRDWVNAPPDVLLRAFRDRLNNLVVGSKSEHWGLSTGEGVHYTREQAEQTFRVTSAGLENAIAIQRVLEVWLATEKGDPLEISRLLSGLPETIDRLREVVRMAGDVVRDRPDVPEEPWPFHDLDDLDVFVESIEGMISDGEVAMVALMHGMANPVPTITMSTLNELDVEYGGADKIRAHLREQLRIWSGEAEGKATLEEIERAGGLLELEEAGVKLVKALIVEARPHTLDVALAELERSVTGAGVQ